MPMPHRTFAQVAKRRLTGKEGRERIREVRALLAELPDYRNGPYADLRKSLAAAAEYETVDYQLEFAEVEVLGETLSADASWPTRSAS